MQHREALTHSCDHTGRVVGGEREARGRVHGCGGGQHVAGVREGREGRHVAGQRGRAEGAALVHQALGEVVHGVLGLFALLGLTGHLPVPGLDAFLLHGQRSVDIVQFKVQAAGVAHRVPVGVSPPQRRRCRLTVCA